MDFAEATATDAAAAHTVWRCAAGRDASPTAQALGRTCERFVA